MTECDRAFTHRVIFGRNFSVHLFLFCFLRYPTLKSRATFNMDKCWLIAIFAVFNLVVLIEAAPRSLDADQIKNLSAIADVETPVRYDGAQLWSVNFVDVQTKLVVINLKKNFG